VVAEIAALLKSYGCSLVVGDKYAAKWVIEAFAKVGITYRHSDADRSAVYLDCLPLFTSGRVRLIDSTRLISQFAALERRVFPTGRDRVDHGRAGRDDLCNAAAGCLVLAARPGAPAEKPLKAKRFQASISDTTRYRFHLQIWGCAPLPGYVSERGPQAEICFCF
jgi:hypothetical protein